jgi:hypothetical protein
VPDNYERDEAGNIVYSADGVTPRKKRGRKPGQQYGASSNSSPKPKVTKTGDRAGMAVEMLAAQFQILNTGLAFVTKFDDWNLSDPEAMDMATATANVMSQFDYMPDPKVTAVLGLVTTTSMIYGSRVYLYRKHLAEMRAERIRQRNAAADHAAANGGAFPGTVVLDMGNMGDGQFT